VSALRKGRGAMICDTNKGIMLLREYNGTAGRMEYEEELLGKLGDTGIVCVDKPVRNKENLLITESDEGTKYILKHWFLGNECEAGNEEYICLGAEVLGRIHKELRGMEFEREIPAEGKPLFEEYSKYNVELKRARNFIRGKNKRNQFELDILGCFDEYFFMAEQAVRTLESLCDKAEYDDCLGITHGNYNYHNIIFLNDNSKCNIALVNFESSRRQLQILDLYNYLRKVMEKYHWDEKTGIKLLESYDRARTISDTEKQFLKALLSYPEKFRKVINHYYNSKKSFIPDKNEEKLKQVIAQQTAMTSFMLKI